MRKKRPLISSSPVEDQAEKHRAEMEAGGQRARTKTASKSPRGYRTRSDAAKADFAMSPELTAKATSGFAGAE